MTEPTTIEEIVATAVKDAPESVQLAANVALDFLMDNPYTGDIGTEIVDNYNTIMQEDPLLLSATTSIILEQNFSLDPYVMRNLSEAANEAGISYEEQVEIAGKAFDTYLATRELLDTIKEASEPTETRQKPAAELQEICNSMFDAIHCANADTPDHGGVPNEATPQTGRTPRGGR